MKMCSRTILSWRRLLGWSAQVVVFNDTGRTYGPRRWATKEAHARQKAIDAASKKGV